MSDTAIAHLGAGLPDAKPKEGYDFAVLDLEIGPGGGSGTLTPAATGQRQGRRIRRRRLLDGAVAHHLVTAKK